MVFREFTGTGGRVGRLGYAGRLAAVAIIVGLGLSLVSVGSASPAPVGSLVTLFGFVVFIVAAVVGFGASARRFHDFGWSGGAALLMLIPVVGFLAAAFLLFRPGHVGSNSHGNRPEGLLVGFPVGALGVGPLSAAWRRLRRKKIAMTALAIIATLYLAGTLAGPVTTQSYSETDLFHTQEGPTADHVLGTDRLGRDIFTRVIWGVQTTVIITVIGVLTGGIVLGISLGLVAGYFGGKIDAVIMRVGEVVAAFPDILLIILIAATLRPRIVEWARDFEDWSGWDGIVDSGAIDYFVVTIAVVPFAWFGMMRLVRGQVLAIRNADYIEAARAVGVSTPRLLFSHILPNVIGPIIVTATFGLGAVAGAELFLSFLGIGVQPPRPSLGFMISDVTGRGTAVVSVLRNHPEQLLAPVAVIWLLIFCWNLLGDALNDAFNPRTR